MNESERRDFESGGGLAGRIDKRGLKPEWKGPLPGTRMTIRVTFTHPTPCGCRGRSMDPTSFHNLHPASGTDVGRKVEGDGLAVGGAGGISGG